ncbi:MAG: hypothetical protein NUW02_00815 [Candidatus Campbellbacteria bacterium]|nr:hypothetical protein [Candidatus Campbellbacteria bacterium]
MTTHTVSKISNTTLLLATLTVFGAFFVAPTPAYATCVPNPRADLRQPNGNPFSVTSNLPTSIEVKNFSTECTYSIHMATYKVFDEWQGGSGTTFLATQTLYSDATNSIGPGITRTISRSQPSTCQYQSDFFEGPSAPTTNPDFAQMPAYTVFDYEFASYPLPLCGPHLTVTKTVINNSGGTALVSAFPLRVNTTSVTSGASNYFHAGTYTVSETNLPGYTAGTWGGDCTASGSVTLAGEQNKTCTITNDDIANPPPTVALRGRIANTGGYTNGPISLPATGGSIDLQWITTNNPTTCTASASPTVAGWSGTKGVSPTNVQAGIVNGTSNRTYTIICSNAGGSDSDSVSVTVPVAPPTALICSPTPVIVPLNTNQQFTATNGSGTYSWTGGGTPATGGNTATFTTQWGTAGAKSVVVTRGIETATCAVTVSAVPPVGLACSPATQQKGVLVPASIEAQNATIPYTWNTGGSPTCEANVSPCTPAYAVANTKTVSLTSGGVTRTCDVVVKGSVRVVSNQPTTWSITRSSGAPLEQDTPSQSETYANQKPGDYTISNVPTLPNFTGPVIEPATASQSIPDTGSDITFTITYTPIGDDDDDTGPKLDLKAGEVGGPLSDGPVRVLYNKSATLSWTSRGVGSCVASGGWTGTKPDNGTLPSNPITSDDLLMFTITCTKVVVPTAAVTVAATSGTLSDSVQIGTRPPQCSDMLDNDGDTFVDYLGKDGIRGTRDDDPGCTSGEDDSESDQKPPQCDVDPTDPRCKPAPIKPVTQCNNGLDDDGDGKIDYWEVTPPNKEADPGCASELDPSELDDPTIEEI